MEELSLENVFIDFKVSIIQKSHGLLIKSDDRDFERLIIDSPELNAVIRLIAQGVPEKVLIYDLCQIIENQKKAMYELITNK